jgi:hypothetical protein
MISERTFASSFHDFWKELLPLLTPSTVHLLYSGHVERLHDEFKQPYFEMSHNENVRDAAVVAEFAYFLAKEASEKNVSIREIYNDVDISGKIQKIAVDLITRYDRKMDSSDLQLNEFELEDGYQISLRYESFFKLFSPDEKISFQLPIPGAGILSSCNADLAIGHSLYEVKTVTRNLSSNDIKQIIIYLALSKNKNTYKWQNVGFFNPKKSTYLEFDIEDLIGTISGGKPAITIFDEIIDFICSSDVQFDSVF